MEVCFETNKQTRLRTHRQWGASQLLLLQELPLNHVQLFKFPWLILSRRSREKFLCLYRFFRQQLLCLTKGRRRRRTKTRDTLMTKRTWTTSTIFFNFHLTHTSRPESRLSSTNAGIVTVSHLWLWTGCVSSVFQHSRTQTYPNHFWFRRLRQQRLSLVSLSPSSRNTCNAST